MNTSTEQPGISRRQLLRYGLLGTLVLATAGGIASVTRTLRSGPGTGYRQLRESHMPMLRRIIPVILEGALPAGEDRKSTRLNSSHVRISYAVFCLKKKT